MISQSVKNKPVEILQAALELFVAYGFHGTPTSKIAAKAGVANGTLFHYYKTKDELVIALYVDTKEKMAAYLEAGLVKETTLEGKFRSIFIHSLQWALANRMAFQFIQQFHTSPFLSKISPGEIEKQLEGHFILLGEGIKAGIIKPLPIPLIYTMITSHVFGLFQYLSVSDLSEADQKKIMNEGFEMLLLMLK